MSATQTKTESLEALGLRRPDAAKLPVVHDAEARAAALFEALGKRIDAAVERAVEKEVARRLEQATPKVDPGVAVRAEAGNRFAYD